MTQGVVARPLDGPETLDYGPRRLVFTLENRLKRSSP
jgi:hypothetical protein